MLMAGDAVVTDPLNRRCPRVGHARPVCGRPHAGCRMPLGRLPLPGRARAALPLASVALPGPVRATRSLASVATTWMRRLEEHVSEECLARPGCVASRGRIEVGAAPEERSVSCAELATGAACRAALSTSPRGGCDIVHWCPGSVRRQTGTGHPAVMDLSHLARREVFSAAWARAAGLDSDAVARAVAEGRAHPLRRGWYAIRAPVDDLDWNRLASRAAFLHFGGRAMVSHQSALIWGGNLDASARGDAPRSTRLLRRRLSGRDRVTSPRRPPASAGPRRCSGTMAGSVDRSPSARGCARTSRRCGHR